MYWKCEEMILRKKEFQMISKHIKFNSVEEITEFVNMMSRQGYNADLSRGSFIVDAKSILGVIALGLGQIIRMDIYLDKQVTAYDVEKTFTKYYA